MAGILPTQTRALDPFADHRFSNSINNLNTIIYGGVDVVIPFNDYVLDTTINANNQSIDISPGVIIKDNVLIHLKESVNLDFTDPDNYVGAQTGYSVFGPSGWDSHTPYWPYIVAVYYNYQRTIPSPVASYVIIKDRDYYTSNSESFLYLCTVKVSFVVSQYQITNLYTTDTEDDTIKRNVYEFRPAVVDGGTI